MLALVFVSCQQDGFTHSSRDVLFFEYVMRCFGSELVTASGDNTFAFTCTLPMTDVTSLSCFTITKSGSSILTLYLTCIINVTCLFAAVSPMGTLTLSS